MKIPKPIAILAASGLLASGGAVAVRTLVEESPQAIVRCAADVAEKVGSSPRNLHLIRDVFSPTGDEVIRDITAYGKGIAVGDEFKAATNGAPAETLYQRAAELCTGKDISTSTVEKTPSTVKTVQSARYQSSVQAPLGDNTTWTVTTFLEAPVTAPSQMVQVVQPGKYTARTAQLKKDGPVTVPNKDVCTQTRKIDFLKHHFSLGIGGNSIMPTTIPFKDFFPNSPFGKLPGLKNITNLSVETTKPASVQPDSSKNGLQEAKKVAGSCGFDPNKLIKPKGSEGEFYVTKDNRLMVYKPQGLNEWKADKLSESTVVLADDVPPHVINRD